MLIFVYNNQSKALAFLKHGVHMPYMHTVFQVQYEDCVQRLHRFTQIPPHYGRSAVYQKAMTTSKIMFLWKTTVH